MVVKIVMISLALLHVGLHVFEHHKRQKQRRKREIDWQRLTRM